MANTKEVINEGMSNKYLLSLRPYRNAVPCGGYKLTGGGRLVIQ